MDDIKNVVESLKHNLKAIDKELKSIENSDIFKRNSELEEANKKLIEKLDQTHKHSKDLEIKNKDLSNALHEQYFNEKISIVARSEKNLNILFGKAEEENTNALTHLEEEVKARINVTRWEAAKNKDYVSAQHHNEINRFEAGILASIKEEKGKLPTLGLSSSEQARLDKLKQQQLTDGQITQLSQKNNFERYIGLNVLNTLGILLFIVGAIAAGNLGHIWVTFILGGGFLVVGEVMNRKKPNVFSLGVTAGGIGILYTALIIGYLVQENIGFYPALGISVAITALAFYLSTRYKAQILLGMSLAGGYLPIMTLTSVDTILYGAAGFVILLSTLAGLLAFKNRWILASFAGMVLNLAAMFYILFFITPWNTNQENLLIVAIVSISTIIYTLIPLVSVYINKTKFIKADLWLIGINIFFSFVAGMLSLHIFGMEAWMGLYAGIYTILYLLMGYLVFVKFAEGGSLVPRIFFVAGMMLMVLFIPLQFPNHNQHWTIAWMSLATLLSIFGVFKDKIWIYRAGLCVGAVAISHFMVLELSHFGTGNVFIPYASITLGSLLILISHGINMSQNTPAVRSYKYTTLINLWFFVMYSMLYWGQQLSASLSAGGLSIEYLTFASMALATIILSRLYSRLSYIADDIMKIVSTALGIIGVAGFFIINLAIGPVTTTSIATQPIEIMVIATAILIISEVVVIYSVYDITRKAVLQKLIGIQYLPLVVSGYILLSFTTNLTFNYGIEFASFWISAFYMAMALGWCILGFIKRYATLRRIGLALALFSVVKLFVFDLQILEQTLRVASYFIMGAILVAMSFIYQYFSKKLESTTK
ncbi:MAG: DUF2339 domain-containing protein [Defluviitaleaceae bacterium]|nr:DUF2339 domain-containing protein [Defluviitaleaceae bacterium]